MARHGLSDLPALLRRALDRLPGGHRRDVGAGYTMAGAALVAAVVAGAGVTVYSGVMAAVLVGSVAPGAPLTPGRAASGVVVSLLTVTLLAVVVVVPAASLAGAAVWRVVRSMPLAGLLGGLLTTLGTYVVGGVLAGGAVVAVSVVDSPAAVPGPTSVGALLVVFGVVVLYTCWVALPVGAVTGVLYERSRG